MPFWPDADSIQLMAHILWIEQAEVLPTEQLLEELPRMRECPVRQGYRDMVDAVDAALFGFDEAAGAAALVQQLAARYQAFLVIGEAELEVSQHAWQMQADCSRGQPSQISLGWLEATPDRVVRLVDIVAADSDALDISVFGLEIEARFCHPGVEFLQTFPTAAGAR